jgi:hypothetical protein
MTACDFCGGNGGGEKQIGDDVIWFICHVCGGSCSVGEAKVYEPVPEDITYPWLQALLPLALENLKERMGTGPNAFEGINIDSGIRRLFYLDNVCDHDIRGVLHIMPAGQVVTPHNHCCRSAVLVVKGRYIHSVGVGPDDELVSTLHGPGSSWFMGDQRAWHRITVLDETAYTFMLQDMKNYDDHESSQNIGAGSQMTFQQKADTWNEYGVVGLELK